MKIIQGRIIDKNKAIRYLNSMLHPWGFSDGMLIPDDIREVSRIIGRAINVVEIDRRDSHIAVVEEWQTARSNPWRLVLYSPTGSRITDIDKRLHERMIRILIDTDFRIFEDEDNL